MNSHIHLVTFLRLSLRCMFTSHVHFVLDITRLVVVVVIVYIVFVDLALTRLFTRFLVLLFFFFNFYFACEECAARNSENNKSVRRVPNVKMRIKSTTTSA